VRAPRRALDVEEELPGFGNLTFADDGDAKLPRLAVVA
jgi:hypothetical protein